MKKFPPQLFVIREGIGDDEYFDAQENPRAFADPDEPAKVVGVYELMKTCLVNTTITLDSIKPAKRYRKGAK